MEQPVLDYGFLGHLQSIRFHSLDAPLTVGGIPALSRDTEAGDYAKAFVNFSKFIPDDALVTIEVNVDGMLMSFAKFTCSAASPVKAAISINPHGQMDIKL